MRENSSQWKERLAWIRCTLASETRVHQKSENNPPRKRFDQAVKQMSWTVGLSSEMPDSFILAEGDGARNEARYDVKPAEIEPRGNPIPAE